MRTSTVAAVCLALAIGAPSLGREAAPGRPAAPRFRLVILKQGWQGLGSGYEWESIWPRLREAAGDALLTIDERDVAAYDWRAQRIVLRPEVTARLLQALHALPDLPERLRKLQALWSSGDLCLALDDRGFLVSFDGQPLYGGIFQQKIAQAAIRFPVLYAAMDEERRIVLRPDPIHFPFGSLWDDGTGDALESPADPDVRELREVFPHALAAMGADDRERVQRFKRLIQDPRVGALFASRGTPAQAPPLHAARQRRGTPLPLTVSAASMRSGWRLFFHPGEPDALADLRYRVVRPSGASPWHDAGDGFEVDFEEVPAGGYHLEIEILDFAGVASGPYSWWFDPEKEAAFTGERMATVKVRVELGDGEPAPARAAGTLAPPGRPPVSLLTSLSNDGWRLLFSLADPRSVRAIHYRFAADSAWRSTGLSGETDLVTRERYPETQVALEMGRLKAGRHRIDVELTDWQGRQTGPFTLWFDPEEEILRHAKDLFGRNDYQWVGFTEFRGERYVAFPLSDKNAWREIRYSFGDCALDQRFPFDPWTDLTQPPRITEKKIDVVMPAAVSMVCVQLVYRDGEVTQPRRFEYASRRP